LVKTDKWELLTFFGRLPTLHVLFGRVSLPTVSLLAPSVGPFGGVDTRPIGDCFGANLASQFLIPF